MAASDTKRKHAIFWHICNVIATPTFMAALCVLSSKLLHPVKGEAAAAAECSVISERCLFPFTHNGAEFYTCLKLSDSNHSEPRRYCKTTDVDRWNWGACDDGCLKEDGSPREFSGELSSGLEPLCKTRPLPCVFPFVYDGAEHSECTDVDSEVFWCATQVDESNHMVDHMWAKCSHKSCGQSAAAHQGFRLAEVKISPDSNPGNISADITLEQQSPESPLIVTGTITGLAPGKHGFHVHQRGDLGDGCKAAGPHFNPAGTSHGDLTKEGGHAGDFGNVIADGDGVADVNIVLRGASIFDDEETSILHRALVIHEGEDDLGTGPPDSDTLNTGNAGARLACGVVQLAQRAEENTAMILIICVLAIVIVGLIILITCLIYKCVKRKRMVDRKKNGPKDGLADDVYSNGTKRMPLYDELSIPFIDASPAPSPKIGRSADR